MSFSVLGLHADLLRGISDAGFSQPTGIQKDSIPPALAGRDVLACSMTGSGKTAAFALPILNRLVGKHRGLTRALILTPTRELAAQIDDHIALLAKHTRIKSASVYGGVSMGPQKRAFQTGADIIIATPGRLMDHFQYDYARLDGLEVLVLDEADRMLDMGFLPDIRRIMSQIPAKRQTLFFSATMPAPIASLTREILKDPVTVNIERKAAPASGIKQTVYPVPQHLKTKLLIKILEGEDIKNVLVFTRTKHRANRLSQMLTREGIGCGVIHGDRSQSQRTHALESFKHGRHRVLVATDVAARGIDVEALSHVINYDLPGQSEDYIHRVGRTARAAATGDAFTFVTPQEESELRVIEKAIGNKLSRLVLQDFDYKQAAPELSGERHGRPQHHRHDQRHHHHGRGDKKPHWRDRGEGPVLVQDQSQSRQENRKFDTARPARPSRPTRPWEQKADQNSRPWWKRSKQNRRAEASSGSRSE